MRRTPNVHPNSAAARARCEECGKRGTGVVMRARVLPSLRLERRRLCDRCRKRLGFLGSDPITLPRSDQLALSC